MTAKLIATVSDRLEAGAHAIEALASTAPPELARFKPAPEKWSILEILGHLHDEECNDFRVRIDYLLNRPGQEWPRIDPERWVREQDFNASAVAVLLPKFLEERRRSIAWLPQLRDRDLTGVYEHPRLGEFTPASLLCAWAAHDLLHVRQISGLVYAYLSTAAAPNRLDYAGQW